jgi:hypothetical protein
VKRIALVLLLLVVAAGLYVLGANYRLYGEHRGAGEPREATIPDAVLHSRTLAQQRAAAALSPAPSDEILFGDLHVHTTFSTDAFLTSLPMMGGDGAHPVADACDYARFCSALDVWSINDHAEASTPQRWSETVDSIRRCNAIAGDPETPDVTAFLGWEWSQVGRRPEDHYGHKNVILRDLGDGEIPTRPIAAAGLATSALRGDSARVPALLPLLDFPNRQQYYDFIEFVEEVRAIPDCNEGIASPDLPVDCYESAATPGELFRKLDEWNLASIVIPHGNTWGFYSPPAISLDKQLTAAENDPNRQLLFEVMSGHGNSEEYREWRAVTLDAKGEPMCPEPSPDYLPSCWRAGEIIEARCLDAGETANVCADRAAEARQNYALTGVGGHLTVPGVENEEWLDSGQCRDCFLPSFNYRPAASGQYGLAISNFDDPGPPKRFRFGFIAASDNHRARPGTGYKEFGRRDNTEASGAASAAWRDRIVGESPDPAPRSERLAEDALVGRGLRALEAERQSSFFTTGGLAAVHASSRTRQGIWDAMERKQVYGTSGDRILLWFHLLNAEQPDGSFGPVPMGGEARMNHAPRFEVRAIGAFRQKPGCPEYSVRGAGPEHLAHLCQNECYHPSDERKLITRIEVVRIRPQQHLGENVDRLIEDPWRVFACEPNAAGCTVQFEDPEFGPDARDTVYYARAIEEPSRSVNAGQLRCEDDGNGGCVSVNPCYGDYRTDENDDCLESIEERAWSSPIFVDHTAAGS